MAGDTYTDTLNQMIELFKNYKPGTVTLENITKLCQTLGLESFIDDVDRDISRLSTASKIIVIDIDFIKSEGKVKDVKLVLASNFDNFNYFENASASDEQTQNNENNILLQSLVYYPDLKEFHKNLEFLYLLDTYSQIDSDPGNSANGSSSHDNNGIHTDSNNISTINLASGTSNSPLGGTTHSEKPKLDLFKYFTELSQYIENYFNDNSLNLRVATNLNSKFGIYILSKEKGENIIANITLKKAIDPQQRLYEYIYSSENREWINESAESYTTGISLVMEIKSNSMWFPKDFISTDIIYACETQNRIGDLTYNGKNNTNLGETDQANNPSALLRLLPKIDNTIFVNNSDHISTGNELYHHEKVQIVNDFTSPLIEVPIFNISNDNINLISDILKWLLWSNTVLETVVEIMTKGDNRNLLNSNSSNNMIINNKSNNPSGFNSIGDYRRSSVTGSLSGSGIPGLIRRRRSSNKGKRSSITEATMLKDEGLQQFSLHEVMAEPVIVEEDDNNSDTENQTIINDGINGENKDVDAVMVIEDDSRMDIDPMELGNDIDVGNDSKTTSQESSNVEQLIQLIISEDHISFGDIASCNLYEEFNKWESFIEIFKKNVD